MAKGLKLSPIFFAALVMLALTAYLYWPHPETKAEQSRPPSPVRIDEVVRQPFAVVIEALGTAKANESVSLTALNSGIVSQIEFDDGELVQKGQMLLQLNAREEQAKVHELEVNLQEARRQLYRLTNLAKENATSQQLLDEQKARVNVLEAQLEVAEAQLAELTVKAPFAGRLGIRQVSVGALVRPADVITTLDDLHLIKVDFSIAESHLPSIAVNQMISASSVAYPDKIFKGKISTIDTRVDPVTRAIQVRALIENPKLELYPGMLLQLHIQKAMLDALVIPEKALIPVEDKQFVFVVEDGKAIRKEVKVGRRKPGIAQILEGIDAGDKVVVEGGLRLQPGAVVNVLPNS